MPPTDRNRIQRETTAKRQVVVSDYLASWRSMVEQWQAPRQDDAVWLMYAASYLFNTSGLRWAVDPVLLSNRVPEAGEPDAARDLAGLDIVLLTHSHADHVDATLWEQLKDSRCHWVVPEHMVSFVDNAVGLPDQARCSIAVPGTEIKVSGARITPFESPHSEIRDRRKVGGVPSTGYRVDVGGASYLFPGDIRTYEPDYVLPFAGVSVVFAHVFLGRGAALEPAPPLMDAFVRFFLACLPEQIVLTHLYEFGRTPEECWLPSHAQEIAEAFAAQGSTAAVVAPEWYRQVHLI